METDITDSFHIYRVDWAHNNLWFYFDNKKFFEVDLNVNFQPGFYEKNRNGAKIETFAEHTFVSIIHEHELCFRVKRLRKILVAL